MDQDQDQDSPLVKRRNDNHSPGPVIRELVPSSHQRSVVKMFIWGGILHSNVGMRDYSIIGMCCLDLQIKTVI